MIKDFKRLVKISKLKKGRVTRFPEIPVILRAFEETGNDKVLFYALEGLFKRDSKAKTKRLIDSLLSIYISGGKGIDSIRLLANDSGLSRILGNNSFFSPNRITEIIKEIKEEKENRLREALLMISTNLLKKIVKREGIKRVTIDIDATYFKNMGKDGKLNYKGEKGMRAMIVSVEETRQILYGYLDAGNNSPCSGLEQSIEKVLSAIDRVGLLEDVEDITVRSDSAGWIAEFMETMSERYGAKFIIKAKRDSSVKEGYAEIRRDVIREDGDMDKGWKRFTVKAGTKKEEKYEVRRCAHVMKGDPRKMISFDLYYYRKKIKEDLVLKPFEYEANWVWYAIATNGDYEGEELLEMYRKRGDSENIIKEYKWDIGLRRFYSGALSRNGVVFLFGAIVYSLMRYFNIMYNPKSWRGFTIASIRYGLQESVYVVKSGRYIILRFNPEYMYYPFRKKFEMLLN